MKVYPMPIKNIKLCGAKARQNGHKACKQPAMKNGRCRLHGGLSTGPRTKEGKRKSAMANYKHGHYTKEAIAERENFRMVMRWKDDLYDI